ncbi:MAG TPA: hypothetical protein VM617_07040 [Thermoanaerobaculia bacterium]|nr:hypothetical protein [Thermoanaerobaculia bacterium]
MYRNPEPAPASRVVPERRGAVVGKFCRSCGTVYPKFRARHSGQPLRGKDHIAAPCSHEGELFAAGADWWEPAVEVFPAPPPAAEEPAA